MVLLEFINVMDCLNMHDLKIAKSGFEKCNRICLVNRCDPSAQSKLGMFAWRECEPEDFHVKTGSPCSRPAAIARGRSWLRG